MFSRYVVFICFLFFNSFVIYVIFEFVKDLSISPSFAVVLSF